MTTDGNALEVQSTSPVQFDLEVLVESARAYSGRLRMIAIQAGQRALLQPSTGATCAAV